MGSSSTIRIPVHAPVLGDEEVEAVAAAIRAGDLSGHTATVRRFEQLLAGTVGAAHALATSSGSSALHLLFATLGVGQGDEVVVPSFTFAPCADMVSVTGATPVFADADPATFSLDVEAAAAAIGPRTRAVLAVHLFGRPCDTTGLRALCDERDVRLVEDCAQALGAIHAGAPVGRHGELATYSFYANKAITTGEGGLLTTDDDTLAARADHLRSHAAVGDDERPYLHDGVGFNHRMPATAAALGIAQHARLATTLARKAAVADAYRRGLGEGITPGPPVPAGDVHAHWANAVLVDPDAGPGGAGGLRSHLRDRGIESRGFYHPLHQHPGVDPASIRGPLPACEAFAPLGVVLPSGGGLTDAEVEEVLTAVDTWLR